MPTTKKAPGKAAAAKKATAKKATAKKATAKKATAKKATAKKATAKKATAKKATAKKAPSKKAPSKKATAVRKAPAKRAAPRATSAPPRPAPPSSPPPPTVAPLPVFTPPPPPPPSPASVEVTFEGPGAQRRSTVAFRWILAVPHFIYSGVLGALLLVVMVIGWFAALFTGRLPEGIATLVTRIIQYSARVQAYARYLLTDRYPSFALDEPDYAVSMSVRPTRLNRAAVLFRFILVIPAAIAWWVVSLGGQLAALVIWLIVLIRGRLPATVFEAEAAVLRYEVRFFAYAAMLTGDYPRGLFGDGDSIGDPGAAGAPAALPAQPRITRLVLSRAGKRLVILFIALGVVVGVGGFVSAALTADRAGESLDALVAERRDLEVEFRRFQTRAPACAVSGSTECIHAASARLGAAFEEFGRDLPSIDFPAYAAPAADDLYADTVAIVEVLDRLATIDDPSDYQAAAAEFERLLNRFDADYRALGNLLFENAD